MPDETAFTPPSPGKPRRKIDLRYDDPKKPESGFHVCVVISGSARPDNPSPGRPEIKGNSVSKKIFVVPCFSMTKINSLLELFSLKEFLRLFIHVEQ